RTLSPELITLEDILAARQVVSNRLHLTPVTGSSYLGNQVGHRLAFKLELFQKTGSFKPRGVLNKLHHLTDEERARGIIGFSSGNHAQAVAWAARNAGIPSTVVMPSSSVRSKVEATRQYGAEVVLTEGHLMDVSRAIQEERDLTMVQPFDDPMIIAGQGTLGLEILDQVPEVAAVVVGVGGGGLISGIATAIKEAKPQVKMIGVEPTGAAVMTQSLRKGEPVQLESMETVADGLAAPFAGEHTLAHMQTFVDDVVIVSDAQILEAMALIMERSKVVAEPAGAAPLAGLLSGQVKLPGGSTVVCVVSGGNVDRERLKELL
ncbi:MAG: threonine/serine dehydratase, partial [Anaerolineae bacterium]